jgi:hypothetical protein
MLLPVLLQGSHGPLLPPKFNVNLLVEFCGKIFVAIGKCLGGCARQFGNAHQVFLNVVDEFLLFKARGG